ncbi:MAG: hypothetical protein Kow0099_14910 [Candidatus Abyssubacteria bacterium]
MNPPVSLVVLTWNGKHLLEECFPSVVEAAEHYAGDTEIIVVDNGSTDGTVEYLHREYRHVSVIALDTNTGFQIGSNTGIKAARHELVFLLNNDMLLEPDCLAPLASHFTNGKLFAVGPLTYFPSSKEVLFSCSAARFDRGLLLEEWAASGGVDHCGRLSPTLYISGGSIMFQKRIFEKLGMFDLLYHPFNCEDFDICYRAWKLGYYMLFEPKSVVYHKHQATIPKAFSKRYYEFINRRNKFLLMWRNLTDPDYFRVHIAFLLPRVTKRTLKGDTLELKAFLAALTRWRQVTRRRRAEKKAYVRTDAEICKLLDMKNLLSPNPPFELRDDGLFLK